MVYRCVQGTRCSICERGGYHLVTPGLLLPRKHWLRRPLLDLLLGPEWLVVLSRLGPWPPGSGGDIRIYETVVLRAKTALEAGKKGRRKFLGHRLEAITPCE